MEIKTQIEFVEGAFETDTGKLVCVQSRKHVDVQLCFKAGMNVPFADIKLYTKDRYVDAKAVFEDAVKLGDEIVKRWNRGPVPEYSPWGGVDRMTVSIYAIMALYEHGHITEGVACNLMNCSDIVSFRIRREEMFREMCRVLGLPLTPAPLPHPGSNVPYTSSWGMMPDSSQEQ